MELDATERVGRLPADSRPPQRSFETFFRDNATATAAVVLALRGSRVGVEDVVQESFVRALQEWDDVAAMDRPDLWVQRVALNLATSRLRRLASEARAIARIGARTPAATDDLGDGDGAFWSAVRRLPAQQARAVALRYAADLSVAEVADVLDVAEGTVKAHLHRARQRLSEQLTADRSREETS